MIQALTAIADTPTISFNALVWNCCDCENFREA